MFTINDVKIGSVILFNKEPYEIIFTQHSKTGRAGAVLRTKLKNLKTGAIINHTFQGGETFQEVDLEFKQAQYLYQSGEFFIFMDNQNFEQFELSEKIINNKKQYLKEGVEISLVYFEGVPISIKLPIKMDYEVVDAPPSVKGNTASGGNKQVILETDLKINVPLFINKGDLIRINTDTGEYCERVKK